MTVESLPETEAHLWVTRPDAIRDPELLQRYRSMLSSDEREKCARYRFEKDQHACLVTRALVRTTLSRYVDVPPPAWRFAANSYGCPSVDEPREARSLRFNLSHTNGLIVCLVAKERDVGVDVEDRDRRGSLLEVADRFFSPFEVAALRRLPPGEQLDRFFLYWTLKESYIKARGMGLAIPLAQFSFELDSPGGRGIEVRFDSRIGDDASRWGFTALSYGRRHAIAVAVALSDATPLRPPALRLREIVPLVD